MSTLDEKKKALELMNRWVDPAPYRNQYYEIASDALRREIAAEEAKLPKAATLEEIQKCLGEHQKHDDSRCLVTLNDEALLFSRARVLRDDIVPWLRNHAECVSSITPGLASDILRKLGEGAP